MFFKKYFTHPPISATLLYLPITRFPSFLYILNSQNHLISIIGPRVHHTKNSSLPLRSLPSLSTKRVSALVFGDCWDTWCLMVYIYFGDSCAFGATPCRWWKPGCGLGWEVGGNFWLGTVHTKKYRGPAALSATQRILSRRMPQAPYGDETACWVPRPLPIFCPPFPFQRATENCWP